MAVTILWIVDFLKYIVDVGLLCILFSSGYRKKGGFFCKTSMVILLSLALCAFGWAWYGDELSEIYKRICYRFILLVMLVWQLTSYKEKVWDGCFALISSIMTKQAAWKLYNIFLLLIQNSGDKLLIDTFTRGMPMWHIGWYLFFLPLAAIIYFVLEKPQQRWRVSVVPQVVLIGVAIMCTNILFNAVDSKLSKMGCASLVMMLYLGEATYSLMTIYLKYMLTFQAKAQEEIFAANQLWKEDQKQYEQMRESMEIIRMKCHDIRHQIYRLKEGIVDDTWINELAEHISIYDSEMQTGNEALDVILTDKQLRCQARGIALMMNIDGRVLNFMEQADIYSLFGNALDNAIEYVSGLEEEKRFISLTVASKGEMVVIHLENYFEGDLHLRDGIPVSKKKDKDNHGIGMQSIKMIAHQYGGWINVFLRDNLFCLDVLIMCPKM